MTVTPRHVVPESPLRLFVPYQEHIRAAEMQTTMWIFTMSGDSGLAPPVGRRGLKG